MEVGTAFVQPGVKYNMKYLISALFLLTAHWVSAQDYPLAKESPFSPGEEIEMKASVGFIKAAEAEFKVNNIIYNVNNKPTYRIDIYARTVGIFDLISSVRDNWGSYYDTTDLVPQQFYRYIKEGRFRKNEILYFDHQKDSVTVAKLHKETKRLEEKIEHGVIDNVQDMVSGYYYLRSIDFDRIPVGTIITINTFFDDKQQPFRVKFVGREEIKTKLGRVKSLILVPIIEKDSLFEEDNTLRVWLSDDLNKIPLKFQAKIYVGYLSVEVKKVKNLRHQLAVTE